MCGKALPFRDRLDFYLGEAAPHRARRSLPKTNKTLKSESHRLSAHQGGAAAMSYIHLSHLTQTVSSHRLPRVHARGRERSTRRVARVAPAPARCSAARIRFGPRAVIIHALRAQVDAVIGTHEAA